MTSGSHRRRNLLTGDWVLVSPHRLLRPWQGSVAEVPQAPIIAYDRGCYLCPGNRRAEGLVNPGYSGVFVFDNDYPALLSQSSVGEPDPLLVSEPETGICRVICYSPDHSRSMSRLSLLQIEDVVRAWMAQSEDLAARPDISAVTIFENRGEMMGASNPHPHGQIWATSSVPTELLCESEHQKAWIRTHREPLLMEYLSRELAVGERVVLANRDFVVLVPYWAAWPFETLLLPRRAVGQLPDLSASEAKSLAAILSDLTRLYDAVFESPFPYTMGWHQAPRGWEEGFVLHAHFYPPLLRSASVRKFMVGFEMLGMPQRDLTPEVAASRLREAFQRRQTPLMLDDAAP